MQKLELKPREFCRKNATWTDSRTLTLVRAYESRNVTFIAPDGSWPIVWERARGVHVWDANGKVYLDLTAAFGVAAAGHANPRVVQAGQRQMEKLLHAMGDVHPHELKAQLARELSRITYERWSSTNSKELRAEGKPLKGAGDGTRATGEEIGVERLGLKLKGKSIFCNSGFEAVEAALKTAMLATGKRGIIAFEKAYHGLGYGALNATHRDHFRGPFRPQLGEFAKFVPFPTCSDQLDATQAALDNMFKRHDIGAVLVEPVQGRGGINIPPPEFLPLLRDRCDAHGALLILDEIYTGFGRTGHWFACEHTQTIPDLICLGKALTGGFPLSVCVGRADLMDAAWPPSDGEAIHTSTFLGHPVGCAMALAQIAEIRRRRLVQRSASLGRFLLSALAPLATRRSSPITSRQPLVNIRGLGLMAGLELCLPDGTPAAKLVMRIIKEMLHRGYIFLPEGEHGNVISFTPPLTISQSQLARCVNCLYRALSKILSLGHVA